MVTGFFSSLFRQFGATYVQFGEPISVLDFVELFSRESKDLGSDLGALGERQALIRDLGVYSVKVRELFLLVCGCGNPLGYLAQPPSPPRLTHRVPRGME